MQRSGAGRVGSLPMVRWKMPYQFLSQKTQVGSI
jgi:hypothetical protein